MIYKIYIYIYILYSSQIQSKINSSTSITNYQNINLNSTIKKPLQKKEDRPSTAPTKEKQEKQSIRLPSPQLKPSYTNNINSLHRYCIVCL